MSGGGINEGIVEQAVLDWFRSLGYATLAGAVLAPGGTAPERTSYDQVVLTGRLRDAALRITPTCRRAWSIRLSRAYFARSRRTP